MSGMQMMSVDDNAGASFMDKLANDDVYHRTASNGEERFGNFFRMRKKAGAVSGGQYQSFHVF